MLGLEKLRLPRLPMEPPPPARAHALDSIDVAANKRNMLVKIMTRCIGDLIFMAHFSPVETIHFTDKGSLPVRVPKKIPSPPPGGGEGMLSSFWPGSYAQPLPQCRARKDCLTMATYPDGKSPRERTP